MLRTAGEGSEKSGKYSGEKHVNGRNMTVKGAAGEGSKRDKEHVIGNRRKGDPCYILAQSLVKLCPKIV